MAGSAVVPFEDSFVLVGGAVSHDLDTPVNGTIFKYDLATEGWTRLPGVLSLPASNVAAMMVDESHFNC